MLALATALLPAVWPWQSPGVRTSAGAGAVIATYTYTLPAPCLHLALHLVVEEVMICSTSPETSSRLIGHIHIHKIEQKLCSSDRD